jgi:hypothetical protein
VLVDRVAAAALWKAAATPSAAKKPSSRGVQMRTPCERRSTVHARQPERKHGSRPVPGRERPRQRRREEAQNACEEIRRWCAARRARAATSSPCEARSRNASPASTSRIATRHGFSACTQSRSRSHAFHSRVSQLGNFASIEAAYFRVFAHVDPPPVRAPSATRTLAEPVYRLRPERRLTRIPVSADASASRRACPMDRTGARSSAAGALLSRASAPCRLQTRSLSEVDHHRLADARRARRLCALAHTDDAGGRLGQSGFPPAQEVLI